MEAQTTEENKAWILHRFKQLFEEPLEKKEEQQRNIKHIRKVRKLAIVQNQADKLDKPMTIEELARAIDMLKNKKLSGKDGLPMELFKTFKEVVLRPLLHKWEEAIHFQALPLFLDEGLTKVVHKKERKELINN